MKLSMVIITLKSVKLYIIYKKKKALKCTSKSAMF